MSMQTGVKGKVYGLVQPKSLRSKPTLKPSIFGDDDDDDNDVNAQLREAGIKKLKQAEAEHAKIQKEDPTVYDYDGVYEKMQAIKQQDAAPKETAKPKSKYIGALMEKSKVREREWGIAYDAKLQRERKNEDDTYMGKEKFVTSAYKKKLFEDQMWKAEEARKAALEEDVTKKKDLGSFYKNLLDRNEAYGGAEEKAEEKKKDKEDTESERENRKRGRDEDEEKEENGSKGDKKEGKEKESEIKEEIKNEGTKEEPTEEEDKEAQKKEKESVKEVRVPPKKLDEDAVSAARLRFLQRKKG